MHDAYLKTMRVTGASIIFTGITLAIGVVTWVFSPLQFQADIGIMLTFMFFVNMLGAIILLPALAAWFVRPKDRGQLRRDEGASRRRRRRQPATRMTRAAPTARSPWHGGRLMTPEEFRRAGHELIDWIADYRERVARGEFPVMSRTAPGALRDALPQGTAAASPKTSPRSAAISMR